MFGTRPYPGALGTVTPSAPARYSPSGQSYSLMGGLADGVSEQDRMAAVMTTLGAGVAVAGMATSAAGGALIGGLASAKWSGAGTGALVSGGLAGLAGGLGSAVTASSIDQSPVPGFLVTTLGAGMLGLGIWRWSKLRKGGR